MGTWELVVICISILIALSIISDFIKQIVTARYVDKNLDKLGGLYKDAVKDLIEEEDEEE